MRLTKYFYYPAWLAIMLEERIHNLLASHLAPHTTPGALFDKVLRGEKTHTGIIYYDSDQHPMKIDTIRQALKQLQVESQYPFEFKESDEPIQDDQQSLPPD